MIGDLYIYITSKNVKNDYREFGKNMKEFIIMLWYTMYIFYPVFPYFDESFFTEHAKQCSIKELIFVVIVIWQNVSFFIYEDKNLKLAILMYYDIIS